jgi:hypothetical protein
MLARLRVCRSLRVMACGAEPKGDKTQEDPALRRGEGIITMSIQKRSLISNRPAEKKVAARPMKETEAIGEAKVLNASALRRRKAAAPAFVAMKKKA